MTGQEIYNIIASVDYHELIKELNKHLENPEAIIVGTFIIVRDMDILEDCNNGEDLRREVIDKASAWEQYAGLPYDECEHLDPDDEDFCPSDDGLAWVAFLDLWEAFEKTANTFKED